MEKLNKIARVCFAVLWFAIVMMFVLLLLLFVRKTMFTILF